MGWSTIGSLWCRLRYSVCTSLSNLPTRNQWIEDRNHGSPNIQHHVSFPVLARRESQIHAKNTVCLRFEVLTTMVMKNTIFWDITPCSPLEVNRRFGETYRLHLQGRKISQRETSLKAGGKLEDGDEMFLRNGGWLSTDYTALYPRRWYSLIQSVVGKYRYGSDG
jgi:hypothetical protein